MLNKAKLTRLFSMEWSRMLQYRIDLILWMTTETMMPLVSLAIWYTVAQSSTTGPTPQDIFTYYIIAMFVIIITQAWGGFFLAREILDGEIIQYLIRPLSVFWKYISNNLVEKILKLAIPLPLLSLILILFHDHFSSAIYVPANVIFFIISLTIAAILSFVLDMALGTIAFWLEDAIQIRQYHEMMKSIAAGVLIPFAMMPDLLKSTLQYLPFRYIISFPLELLLGQIPLSQIYWLIGYQVLWVIILIIAIRILWQKGLKRYAVPGQ